MLIPHCLYPRHLIVLFVASNIASFLSPSIRHYLVWKMVGSLVAIYVASKEFLDPCLYFWCLTYIKTTQPHEPKKWHLKWFRLAWIDQVSVMYRPSIMYFPFLSKVSNFDTPKWSTDAQQKKYKIYCFSLYYLIIMLFILVTCNQKIL